MKNNNVLYNNVEIVQTQKNDFNINDIICENEKTSNNIITTEVIDSLGNNFINNELIDNTKTNQNCKLVDHYVDFKS